jgi:hypothetical protein
LIGHHDAAKPEIAEIIRLQLTPGEADFDHA